MIENLPEVVVIGDIELFFFGAALALGFPKLTRRVLNRRYRVDEDEGVPCLDCPTERECMESGCQRDADE